MNLEEEDRMMESRGVKFDKGVMVGYYSVGDNGVCGGVGEVWFG